MEKGFSGLWSSPCAYILLFNDLLPDSEAMFLHYMRHRGAAPLQYLQTMMITLCATMIVATSMLNLCRSVYLVNRLYLQIKGKSLGGLVGRSTTERLAQHVVARLSFPRMLRNHHTTSVSMHYAYRYRIRHHERRSIQSVRLYEPRGMIR